MSEPLVSVCIPSYNSAAFIGETVQSVLDQTYENIELIVVDDASTDGTAELVQALDDRRLRLERNHTNLGAVANWNRAVGLASGTYVKLVCGDDLLRPECIARQVEPMERDPSVVVVAGRRDVVTENGEVLFAGRGLTGLLGTIDGDEATRRTVRSGTNQLGEPACVLLRADKMRDVGDFHGHVPYMIDIEYWLRMLRHGRLHGLDETVATFRVVATSWSNRIAWRQSLQAARLFLELKRAGRVGALDLISGVFLAALLNVARMATYMIIARRKPVDAGQDTADEAYTNRLRRKQEARWKKILDVQAPYRWNLRRLEPGFVLDVGCGLGRNLSHLDGSGVGVDHNTTSVAVARSRGFEAFTPEEFEGSGYAAGARFDSLLMAHLLEHMDVDEATRLVKAHLARVKPGGKVIVITPQERGHGSDATHVAFMDFAAVRGVLENAGVVVERQYSFPFPRMFGRLFIYNEFVTVGRLP